MKILVYPKASNPYQELLYSKMRLKGDEITYLVQVTKKPAVSLFLFIPRIIIYRIRGFNYFHLHWNYGFSLHTQIWQYFYMQKILYIHYILCLRILKVLKYKLIWTAHNILPHDRIFLDDVAGRRQLVKFCDVVIAHSSETVEGLKQLGIIANNSVVIPHGNYIGAYQNNITKKEARVMFNFSDKDFIVLFFGQIRDYKGIDDLIHAYKELKDPQYKLIIAGKCPNPDLQKTIKESILSHKVLFYSSYIPGIKVQNFFNAADVVVLPFRTITTSGSAMLAFSFGKPLVIPNLDNLTYIPDTICYKYDHKIPSGLLDTIKKIRDNTEELKIKSRESLRYAKLFSWEEIALETRKAFMEE